MHPIRVPRPRFVLHLHAPMVVLCLAVCWVWLVGMCTWLIVTMRPVCVYLVLGAWCLGAGRLCRGGCWGRVWSPTRCTSIWRLRCARPAAGLPSTVSTGVSTRAGLFLACAPYQQAYQHAQVCFLRVHCFGTAEYHMRCSSLEDESLDCLHTVSVAYGMLVLCECAQ